jgi:hypothetical protein
MSRNPDIQPEPLDRDRRWIVDLTHTLSGIRNRELRGKDSAKSRKVESQDLIRTVDWQRDLYCGIQVVGPAWIRSLGNGGALSADSPKRGIPTHVWELTPGSERRVMGIKEPRKP